MRSRAVGAVLATVVLLGGLGVAGWSAYRAGYSRGLVENATDVVVPAYRLFPGFGVLFGVIFLFLIFGFMSRLFLWRRWGGDRRGHGGHWGNGWNHYEGSPMERRLTEWHEKAHGESEGRRYRSAEQQQDG